MGCHALLQGVFPIYRSNLRLLHCRQILYHWATKEALLLTWPLYNYQNPVSILRWHNKWLTGPCMLGNWKSSVRIESCFHTEQVVKFALCLVDVAKFCKGDLAVSLKSCLLLHTGECVCILAILLMQYVSLDTEFVHYLYCALCSWWLLQPCVSHLFIH